MNINFHFFVSISTLVFIFFLKHYKSSLIKKYDQDKKHHSFIYVLFLPIILYLAYYLFIIKDTTKLNTAINLLENLSEDIITSPYPDSLSSL